MNPYHFVCWIPGEAKSERKRQRIITGRDGSSFIGKRTDVPDRREWKTWVRHCVALRAYAAAQGRLHPTEDVIWTGDMPMPLDV